MSASTSSRRKPRHRRRERARARRRRAADPAHHRADRGHDRLPPQRRQRASIVERSPTGAGLALYRREVRLVFQDPFASLNPRMTVQQIIGDPLIVNGIATGARAGASGSASCCASSASIRSAWSAIRTPSPAASASASASRGRSRSTAHHRRRRGDLGARRLDPQPDPRPAARHPEAARISASSSSRHDICGGALFLRSRRGDAPGPDRRDRDRGADLHRSEASPTPGA